MPEVQARRRSGLLQERSRRTRQQLVRAALDLWAERGFETGVADTTVEEIVERAGVTKGTFYFHFSRKEEILQEMALDTAEVAVREAERCVKASRSFDTALTRVLSALARHVRAAPPAAVARAVAEIRRSPQAAAVPPRATFREAFEVVFAWAQRGGELPADADPGELAAMLQALAMDSILDWTEGHGDLLPSLRKRSDLIVRGIQTVAARSAGTASAGAT
ncbi:MAG: TetR/AcrR family transcriptional regulator [Acidimicrobiaceae bacterium]|nr:TetR/AcrR family transcriptional regulator [Acidimicrobiaceae bacterium]